MATRKVKRYNGEDGSVTEGANSGIDDDTRARAMKFMRDREENPGMYEAEPEENFKPTPKAAPAPVAKAAPAKASNENYGNEGRRPVREAKKANVLEEAKENVRRSNAARDAMAMAARRIKAGDMPKRGPGLSAIKMKSGGKVGSASSRGDGIAMRGKTRGKYL